MTLPGALVKAFTHHGCRYIGFLNVNGATGYTPAPGISETTLHGVALGIAISAHQLDGITGDLAGYFIGKAAG